MIYAANSHLLDTNTNLLINEQFYSDYTSSWTERDVAGQLTISLLSPNGVQFSGDPFTQSRHLRYNSTLASQNINSFEIKCFYSCTSTGAGSISIGHVNFPINPNPNRGVYTRALNISGDGERNRIQIWTGAGGTSEDAQTFRTQSAILGPVSANTMMCQTFRRELVGANAVYTASLYYANRPDTKVITQWVDTGATAQVYWNTTYPILAQIGGTNQIRYYTLEVFS